LCYFWRRSNYSSLINIICRIIRSLSVKTRWNNRILIISDRRMIQLRTWIYVIKNNRLSCCKWRRSIRKNLVHNIIWIFPSLFTFTLFNFRLDRITLKAIIYNSLNISTMSTFFHLCKYFGHRLEYFLSMMCPRCRFLSTIIRFIILFKFLCWFFY
jgi:hypothetical protein